MDLNDLEDSLKLPQDTEWILNGEWLVLDKGIIGVGSFGKVVKVKNIKTGEIAAAKLEKEEVFPPQLILEARLLEAMQGGIGIPKFHFYGKDRGYNYLIMECLGPTVEQVFNLCGKTFASRPYLC